MQGKLKYANVGWCQSEAAAEQNITLRILFGVISRCELNGCWASLRGAATYDNGRKRSKS
jgi:hypothetical protein